MWALSPIRGVGLSLPESGLALDFLYSSDPQNLESTRDSSPRPFSPWIQHIPGHSIDRPQRAIQLPRTLSSVRRSDGTVERANVGFPAHHADGAQKVGPLPSSVDEFFFIFIELCPAFMEYIFTIIQSVLYGLRRSENASMCRRCRTRDRCPSRR